LKKEEEFKSGYVSIIGQPNVGKSTLLNSLLGEKVSIVTPRSQTTRNRILGIKTIPDAQIIFIDTPGIHRPKHKLGEVMVRTAVGSLEDVDLILLMAEPHMPDKGDRDIVALLKNLGTPVVLLINKIDTIKKHEILPVINRFSELFPFAEIIPVSALRRDGMDVLVKSICDILPPGPKYFPDDLFTDQAERFMVSEIIREKIMAMTHEELPHAVAVEIVKWTEREDGLISISCNIYVEREGQKAIIIGKHGSMLKAIGSAARIEIEKLLNANTFLALWVKVRKKWRDDDQLLKELGYRV
jgi:GTP-binding protein Era